MKNLERPKQALSPYFLYYIEQFKNVPKSSTVTDASKILAESWKSLSDDGRQKYIVESNVLKEKYNVELTAWQQKMKEDDKIKDIDIVQKEVTKAQKKKLNMNND